MDSQEIDSALDELENRLDRLRSLYEQYFMGIEKIEPTVPRKDVDRRFWILRRTQVRNTARRFRLQTLVQRYNTFQQHWTRICREIENGTYVRHLLKARKNLGAEPKTWAAKKRLGLLRRDRATDSNAPPADDAAATENSVVAQGSNGATTHAPAPMPAGRSTESVAPRAPSSMPRPSQVNLTPLDLDLEDAPTIPPPRPPANLGRSPGKPPLPTRPNAAGVPPKPGLPLPRPAGAAPARPATTSPGGSLPPIPRPASLAPPKAPATAPVAAPPPPAPARTAPVRPPTPTAATPTAATPAAAAATATATRTAATTPTAATPTAATPAAAAATATATVATTAVAAATTAQKPSPPAMAAAARDAATAARAASAGLSDERVAQLHAELNAARRQLNQSSSSVSIDSLAKSLRDTESKLKGQHGGKSVDFQVVIKDGKPIVRPVVRR